ncbi:hypothetical protein M419DRAFT_51868, partial [Trichoderma reesei RUT C-30]
RVVALVFYGRREFVSILNHYLKRNLKENGGLLDEVIFAVKTDNRDDIGYVQELVASTPAYSQQTITTEQGKYNWSHWTGSWSVVSEPESIYIKIDDDVIFFDDCTIPALVKRLLEDQQYFAVSANVVNGGAISGVHYHMGVYEPYWPEVKCPPQDSTTTTTGSGSSKKSTWRLSELPEYQGPIDGPPGFRIDGSTPAPYQGHRWLHVSTSQGKAFDPSLFPCSTLGLTVRGPNTTNWAAAAQAHYSLLHHLETSNTSQYRFGIWDFMYERCSINFIAIRGRDILDAFPFPIGDDEEFLTRVRPKELGRRVVVDGAGLVAHFAFTEQRTANNGAALMWTDLLARYRAYAEE